MTESPDYLYRAQFLKRLGWPFCGARHFHVYLEQSDLPYIENVIKSDKMWHIIADGYKTLTGQGIFGLNDGMFDIWCVKRMNLNYSIINFFQKFLNDKNCPKRVRHFLYMYLGQIMGEIKENGDWADYQLRRFFVDRWFGKCL